MNILIVEDTEQWREVASATLGGEHQLTFATTMEEALEALSSQTFDWVVADLFIPETADIEVGEHGRPLIALLEAQRQHSSWVNTTQVPETTLAETGESISPLGLYVFGVAARKGLPVVIFYQGDRHAKAFGFVRNAIDALMIKAVVGHWFFFPWLCVLSGHFLDKNKKEHWEAAIQKPEQYDDGLKAFNGLASQVRLDVFGVS